MKTGTENATAKIKDYSLIDASDPSKGRKDGSTEVEVKYPFTWTDIETEEELHKELSIADLIKLANQRRKATANSTARQKAIAPYMRPADDPTLARERMINDLVDKFNVPRDVAEQQVDGMIANFNKPAA